MTPRRFEQADGMARSRRALALAALAACILAASLSPSPAPAAPASLGAGGWSYFGDPRAVHAEGRTFVGWAGTDGYTHVATLEGGQVVEHRRVGPKLSVDDHNNPSLHVEPDGRITFFYSDHNGRRMYYRTSTVPYSLASLSRVRWLPTNTRGIHGYTYPNPLVVDGRLWLLFRGGDYQPNYSIRNGRWTRAATLVRGPLVRRGRRMYRHRPYTKYASDGHTIHGTFTEGNIGRYDNSIYYAQVSDGEIRTAAGRTIAPLGAAPSVKRLELVRRYEGYRQWALDIALDRGHPVIVYKREGERSEYWYARFDGDRWRNHPITSFRVSHRGQVGSVTLDHEDPGTVYLTRDGSKGRQEIEVWATPDGGGTWSHRPVTGESLVDNLRPVSPRGLTGREQVLWFAGIRGHWTSFRTTVLAELLRAAHPGA